LLVFVSLQWSFKRTLSKGIIDCKRGFYIALYRQTYE
jgi:hypothetical protein